MTVKAGCEVPRATTACTTSDELAPPAALAARRPAITPFLLGQPDA